MFNDTSSAHSFLFTDGWLFMLLHKYIEKHRNKQYEEPRVAVKGEADNYQPACNVANALWATLGNTLFWMREQ